MRPIMKEPQSHQMSPLSIHTSSVNCALHFRKKLHQVIDSNDRGLPTVFASAARVSLLFTLDCTRTLTNNSCTPHGEAERAPACLIGLLFTSNYESDHPGAYVPATLAHGIKVGARSTDGGGNIRLRTSCTPWMIFLEKRTSKAVRRRYHCTTNFTMSILYITFSPTVSMRWQCAQNACRRTS